MLIDGSVACADITDEEDPDCQLEVSVTEGCAIYHYVTAFLMIATLFSRRQVVLRDIVNTQNFQIQTMLGILEAKNYPETKDCVVEVPTTSERVIEDVPEEEKDETGTDVSKSVNEPTSGNAKNSTSLLYAILALSLVKSFL